MINKQFENSNTVYKALKDQKIDCLVTPGFPVPAPKHGDSRFLAMGGIYTMIFNILDLPTVALPTRVVKKGEDVYKCPGRNPKDIFVKKAKHTVEGSVGMPMGLQLSCLPYEDEKVCGVALQFEKLLKYNSNLPVELSNK